MMSRCSRFEERIMLLAYGELDGDDAASLRSHLDSCPACREYQESLLGMKRNIPHDPIEVPDEQTMNALRVSLSRQLRANQAGRQPLLHNWKNLLQPAPLLRFAFAVLLVLVGYFAGLSRRPTPTDTGSTLLAALLSGQEPIQSGNSAIEPMIADVSNVSYNPATRKIELHYTLLNEIRVIDDISNPVVRQLLGHAVRQQENAGVRLRAVKTIQELTRENIALDNELVQTLAYLADREQNPGIRLKILKTLRGLPPDVLVRTLLLRIVITERDEALRMEAMETLLESYVDPGDVNLLAHIARSDSNLYIRRQAEEAVQKINAPTRPSSREDHTL